MRLCTGQGRKRDTLARRATDYAGLAQLFRLLRNALGVDVSHSLGSADYGQLSGGNGKHHAVDGRQRSRSLVTHKGQSPVCGAFQCVP